MRELSLGLTRPIDLFHVLRKELSVGIINGIVLGILIGIVAWVWKDNMYLGLVIGLALSLNTIIAVSIGGTVPLILKHFGVDPAVASGPFVNHGNRYGGILPGIKPRLVFHATIAELREAVK